MQQQNDSQISDLMPMPKLEGRGVDACAFLSISPYPHLQNKWNDAPFVEMEGEIQVLS